MQSRNQSVFALLLLTAVACAYQNAGAGIDDTGDDDTDDGGSSVGGSAPQAGKTTLSTSGSASTPIAGTTGKGGTTSTAGSGGKSSTGGKGGSGGKAGSGGKSGGGSGGMEAAGGGDDGPANMPLAGLSLTFMADNAAATVDFLGGELHVINDTAQPIPLADMKVRYYFTNEATSPTVMMNWAQFGQTNNLGGATCTGQVVKLPQAVAEADSYVELTCSAASASDLTAGTMLKLSWKAGSQGQKFTQTGDYSFAGPSKILIVNGNTIVWGVEPS